MLELEEPIGNLGAPDQDAERVDRPHLKEDVGEVGLGAGEVRLDLDAEEIFPAELDRDPGPGEGQLGLSGGPGDVNASPLREERAGDLEPEGPRDGPRGDQRDRVGGTRSERQHDEHQPGRPVHRERV